MPSTPEKDGTPGVYRLFTFGTVLLLGLPPLYLLSTGPVLWLLEKTHNFGGAISDGWVMTFYGPVVWLYLHTPMREPIEWYLGIWGVK